MYAKLLLILGVVLGVIALAFLGPLGPAKQPDVVTPGGEVVDSGHFVLARGNEKWLDESFTLFLNPDGGYFLTSQGTLTVSGTQIAIADETRYDGDYRPLAYELDAKTPSGAQIITAQRGDRGLTMEVLAGVVRQAVDIAADRNLLLLDNNVIAHYAVLLRAIQSGSVAQTFSAAVPQALVKVPARWEEPTEALLRSGAKSYVGKKTTIHLADTLIDLVTYEGRLVGLVNRSQGTVAYDMELFPDGLSLEEMASPPAAGVVERDVSFPSGDLALSGTLALPAGQTAPRCAVLFVAGSGPVERDGNAPGLQMDAYRQLARRLAENGIVSLRYDKRGVGGSEGDAAAASRADLESDVRAAWAALAAQPEAAGLPRVALGHSEGTYLVEDLAAGNPDVAGLILLCGSPQSLAGVTRWQVETLVRQQGASDDQVRAALEQEDQYLAFVKTSHGQWADYSIEALRGALPWLTEAAAQQLKTSPLGLAWLREHYNADPVTSLSQITCPVLILSAGKDIQVPPADGQAMAAVLTAGGHHDVTAMLIPDLNHMLRHHPEEPSIIYRHLDEPVDPRVTDAVLSWAERVFGG